MMDKNPSNRPTVDEALLYDIFENWLLFYNGIVFVHYIYKYYY